MAIIPVQRASMAAIVGALQFNYIWEGEVDNYSLGGVLLALEAGSVEGFCPPIPACEQGVGGPIYLCGRNRSGLPGEIKEAPTITGGGPGNAPFYIRVGGRTI